MNRLSKDEIVKEWMNLCRKGPLGDANWDQIRLLIESMMYHKEKLDEAMIRYREYKSKYFDLGDKYDKLDIKYQNLKNK